MTVDVHPLVSPWGRFGLYSFFIDAPEPAIVDTGIHSSPAEGMAPAIAALGRRIEDVRWILLTHGHIDHIGGAYALWEMTGRKAQVVIHEADAELLRHRSAHVEQYRHLLEQYVPDPQGAATQMAAVGQQVISGEMEPTMLVRGGETLSLGGDVTVTVHATPGHTAGSVAYLLEPTHSAFVGDTVQMHGAASFFPGYEDPAAYRASLEMLRDLAPHHLYQGHPYRRSDGEPYGVHLDADQTAQALQESLDIEAHIAAVVAATGLAPSDSPYGPFAAIAEELGYEGDPTLEPFTFFTTMDGYRSQPRPDDKE